MSETTQVLIRSGRRTFVQAAVAFAAFMRADGIDVDPSWDMIAPLFSDPALARQDEAIIRRWYASLGLDYDADFEAARIHARAKVTAMLKHRH